MGIAFRSILRFSTEDLLLSKAEKIVNSWLATKGWPQLAELSQSEVRSDSSLSYTRISSPEEAVRWVLSENWEKPSWAEREDGESRTTISLIEKNEELWLWVEIDTPTIRFSDSRTGKSFAEPQFAQTPSVLDSFLRLNKAFDGRVPVASEPLLISRRRQVDELVMSLLTDPERVGAIFVTSPPHASDDTRWRADIRDMLSRARGMGYSYIVSRGLIDYFNDLVGEHLTIHPGSIRTFLPAVQIGDAADSQRHRRLTFTTLSSMDTAKAGRMLRSVQVARFRSVHLPSFFVEAERALVRTSRFPADSRAGSPNKVVSESEYLEAIALAEIYEKELQEEKLNSEELKDQVETLWLENAEFSKALEKLENQKSFLERKLVILSPQDAFEEAPQENRPESWGELVENIEVLPGLVFAGSTEAAQDLEHFEVISSALGKAWGGLKTLSAYSQMKKNREFRGSLEDYIRDTSHGGYCSISMLKWESESVENNPKYKVQRMIPVPKLIDPSGFIMCKAHITLSRVPPAPTMYFFDAVEKDGTVFIGHIGAHLDNTLTN